MLNRIETLKTHIAQIPPKDVDFAKSLIRQWEAKGKLSDKQLFWVDKLADVAEGVPDFTAPEPIRVGTMAGVLALFAKTDGKLKFPALRLGLEDGTIVAMRRAGANSKHPGSINIVNKGTGNWMGRVTVDGKLTIGGLTPNGHATMLERLLRKLSDDAAGTAAAFGKLTGLCCFCASELSDPKSTAVGYGKTCASHWGLPWGSKN